MKLSATRDQKSWPFLWLVFLSVTGLLSCVDPIDMERQEQERGTLGEELHRILYKDLIRSPYKSQERAEVFLAWREDFVTAVDTMARDDLLDELDQVMARMMPLYDNGLIPGSIRKSALVLEEGQGDAELMAALAHITQLPQLVSQPIRSRFISHLFQFPELTALLSTTTELLLSHGGGDQPSDATLRVLASLSEWLTEREVSDDPSRFSVRAVRLLTTVDPAFLSEGVEPLYAVRVDQRGRPAVYIDESGLMPLPFIDADGDGLADTDEYGALLTQNGRSVEPFGPAGESISGLVRDEFGRLYDGHRDCLALEYFDLNQTGLAYFLRDAGELMEAEVPFDLLRALRSLLGEPIELTDEKGSYRAFPADGPLINLVKGTLTVLDNPEIPYLLEGVTQILREHPDELARTLYALERTLDILDLHEGVDIDDKIDLIDRLLPLIYEAAATPGLLEDLLIALEEPITQELAPISAGLLDRRNTRVTVIPGDTYDACFQSCDQSFEVGTYERMGCIQACPTQQVLGLAMDRSLPESRENMSLVQRIGALMWEAAGTEYSVSIEQFVVSGFDFSNTAASVGHILYIEDLAEAYLLTISGDLVLEELINPDVIALGAPLGMAGESVTGIVLWITDNVLHSKMSEYPTTAEVTRFFNLYPIQSQDDSVEMLMNNAVCRSGWLCVDAHADALFVIEASGMVDALHPVASVFNEHGKTALFAEIISVIYEYYPSPEAVYLDPQGQPLPFVQANLRSAEPALMQVLNETDLLDAIAELASIMRTLELSDGSGLVAHLDPLLVGLLYPIDGLVLPDGSTTALDPSGNIISPLRPIYLILDPLRDFTELLDNDPLTKARWENVFESLTDTLIATELVNGVAQFSKPGAPLFAALVVETFNEILGEKFDQGTSTQWLTELQDDLVELVTGRGLFAAVELFDWVDARPEAYQLLKDFSLHALQKGVGGAEQVTLLFYKVLAGFVDEVGLVAVSHFLAHAIDPYRIWEIEGRPDLPYVIHGLVLLDETTKVDPEGVILEVLAAGFEPSLNGDSPLEIAWEVHRQVNRLEPGSTEPLTAADFDFIFGELVDFLYDEERGAERLYDLMEFATYGVAGKPEE